MIKDNILKLRGSFPLFDKTYDGDENVYLVYGAFGSYALDIINICMCDLKAVQNYFYSNLKEHFKDADTAKNEMIKIFSFVDDEFLKNNNVMIDVLNTCFFEAIMSNDYSYNLSRKYFSKETYNHYLEVTKRVI